MNSTFINKWRKLILKNLLSWNKAFLLQQFKYISMVWDQTTFNNNVMLEYLNYWDTEGIWKHSLIHSITKLRLRESCVNLSSPLYRSPHRWSNGCQICVMIIQHLSMPVHTRHVVHLCHALVFQFVILQFLDIFRTDFDTLSPLQVDHSFWCLFIHIRYTDCFRFMRELLPC